EEWPDQRMEDPQPWNRRVARLPQHVGAAVRSRCKNVVFNEAAQHRQAALIEPKNQPFPRLPYEELFPESHILQAVSTDAAGVTRRRSLPARRHKIREPLGIEVLVGDDAEELLGRESAGD